MGRALTLAVALLLIGLLSAPSISAAGPTVTDGGVENNFPRNVVFKVSAQSDAPITDVRLRYTILPDGTAASAQAEIAPQSNVSTTYSLDTNNPPKIYLPPGTTIQYRWEVTDEAGQSATTEEATFTYDDIRFNWKRAEGNGVSIYYYSGSDRDAQAMLETAGETIDSMSKLLGASVSFPVKVWAYRSSSDMSQALARRSEGFEQSVITAGVRVSSDTVLVLGNASFDTLRHELTHVLTAVAGEGPFGRLPAWLDEGTAVYGQEDPGSFRGAVEAAIRSGDVLSVRSISSYPGDPKKVNLFYGQAWSLVSFLVDKGGPEKFAQLFAEIKSGNGTDSALKAVYGFDQDGLDEQWRASQGLREEENSDGGVSTGTILAVALGTLVLAILVAGLGLFIAVRVR